MKKWNVYQHSNGDVVAVKEGFNWWAFFFVGLWAFSKRLMWAGAIGLSLTIAANRMPSAADIIAFPMIAILMIAYGFMGNGWVTAMLEKKGYARAKQLEAASEEGAKANYLRDHVRQLSEDNRSRTVEVRQHKPTASPMTVPVSEHNTNSQQATQPAAVVMNGPKADLPKRAPAVSSLPAATSTQYAITPPHTPTDQLTRATMSSSLVHESLQESMAVDESAIYTAIANELESGATDKGLWTRLFAECDGDENRTKVAYIKQRAEKLIAAEQSRLAEIKRQYDEETVRLEKMRFEGLSLRQQLSAGNQSDETKEKLKLLSSSQSAATFRCKVRTNLLEDVEAMLRDNPLLVATTDSDDKSPLHIAVSEQYVKMCQLLLENGAATDVKNMFGATPLDFALKNGNQEIVEIISAHETPPAAEAKTGLESLSGF